MPVLSQVCLPGPLCEHVLPINCHVTFACPNCLQHGAAITGAQEMTGSCAGSVTRLPDNQSVSTTRAADSSGDASHAVLQPVSSSQEAAPAPKTGSAALSSTPSQSAGLGAWSGPCALQHARGAAACLLHQQLVPSCKVPGSNVVLAAPQLNARSAR